jgi:alkanesulfonate monooxygenase SsuD/methylene tetrahydromethanopterin reductase-like flavin-dependent oxidoreductase (luciferase family)
VRYGLQLANVGTYADPRAVVRAARAAEAAGWDALLLWDHLAFVWDGRAADPWVTLGAVAASTERLILGTGVTPVARRRPHVVAHELATLETLAPGRVLFGAGLGGVEREFSAFGDAADALERAARLDEGLDVIRALLAGGPVDHHGRHFSVSDVELTHHRHPIPIWIGGTSSAARRRAARFDGWFADSADVERMTMTPAELETKVATIGRGPPFDVALIGYSSAGNAELHGAYAGAGATWWLEAIHDLRGSAETMLARIEAGP